MSAGNWLILGLVGVALLPHVGTTILYSDKLSPRAKRHVHGIFAVIAAALALTILALTWSWIAAAICAPLILFGVRKSIEKVQICDNCGHYQHTWWPLRGPRKCFKCGRPTA